MIIAKSLVSNKVYIYPTEEEELALLKNTDVEIVHPLVALSDPYEYMTHDSAGCTAPANKFSAGHCFGQPTVYKVGKSATLYGRYTSWTRVLQDYYYYKYGPFQPIACFLLRMFGRQCDETILDLVEVDEYNKVDAKLVGVLSAAPAFTGTPGFFADTTFEVDKRKYIGTQARGYSYDFPEKRTVQWQGTIVDYVVYRFLHGSTFVTAKGWVIKSTIPFKPGMSGSPAFI